MSTEMKVSCNSDNNLGAAQLNAIEKALSEELDINLDVWGLDYVEADSIHVLSYWKPLNL